jgi:hypothetical protein
MSSQMTSSKSNILKISNVVSSVFDTLHIIFQVSACKTRATFLYEEFLDTVCLCYRRCWFHLLQLQVFLQIQSSITRANSHLAEPSFVRYGQRRDTGKEKDDDPSIVETEVEEIQEPGSLAVSAAQVGLETLQSSSMAHFLFALRSTVFLRRSGSLRRILKNLQAAK